MAPLKMAISLFGNYQNQTQLQRSTSEANQSIPYCNGLATAAPLKPRLGRNALRFSPYGKSLTEERNILAGGWKKKSYTKVLESESFRSTEKWEGNKRITSAHKPTLASSARMERRISIGFLVNMSQVERGDRRTERGEANAKNQMREECQLGEETSSKSKVEREEGHWLKKRRLTEEVRRIYSDKAMEVVSKELKGLELSN